MRFDAYLLDVQGTLLDLYSPVTAAVAAHLREVGRPDVDPGDVTRAWCKEPTRGFEDHLARLDA